MNHYFRWWTAKISIWIATFFVAPVFLLSKFEFVEALILSAVIATVAVFLASIIRSTYLAIQREIARGELRRRVEQSGPEIRPEGRHISPPHRPLVLEDLKLLIEKRNTGRGKQSLPNVGMLVNPETDIAIRPFAVIELNDRQLIGRQVTLKFCLIDPRGQRQFETVLTLSFTKIGYTRVVPRNVFRLPHRPPHGTWDIRLYAGNRLWGRKEFSLTTVTLNQIASETGSDMEMGASAERKAEEFAPGADPKEVLGDILE